MRKIRLPRRFQPLFPEYALRSLHPRLDAPLIILRILDRGGLPDLRWLFRHYAESEIRAAVLQDGARLLSDRSLNFWRWWFHLPPLRLPARCRIGRRLGGLP